MPLHVSFIIPLYNCLPLTQAMLASLQATLPRALAHEIIFIDDGSTDGTRDWLKTLASPNGLAAYPAGPFRVVFNERNLGYAISNNRAAALARGSLLVLLNNDLVLQPRWLERMLTAHAHLGTRAGAIGNVQLDVKTGLVDHAGLVINTTGKPEHVRARPPFLTRVLRPAMPVPAVTGACLAMARSLWQSLGGFDEAYINGGEDIDLCFRARAAGKINAIAPRSVVLHHVSSSPGRKRRDEQNSYRLACRWRDEILLPENGGPRAWCREYLADAFVHPKSQEYRLALAACAHAAGLRRTPPPEAVAGVKDRLAREFAHWATLFG